MFTSSALHVETQIQCKKREKIQMAELKQIDECEDI